MSVLRPLSLVWLLLLSLDGSAAGDDESLEADFLEYLANMEGDEDDWTLLADAKEPPAPPPKATSEPRKTTKEAVEPAVDKR